jgi:hypothetical protein
MLRKGRLGDAVGFNCRLEGFEDLKKSRMRVLFLHFCALLSSLKYGVTMMLSLPPPEDVLTSAISGASESASASSGIC